MAWNEPGKSDKPENSPRKPDTPPDLDEVLKNLQQKLKGLFGQKKTPFTPAGPSASSPKSSMMMGPIFIFVAVVFLLIWFFSGFFIVAPAEKAAILRFGKYVKTDEPGLHWIPPFISSRYVVNVQQVLTYPYQAEMLIQDENIVSVGLVVKYRINNLQDYLFNVANPNESLQQATASALRQVIGQTKLDDVLTSGLEKVGQETQEVLEKTLERYHAGLIVTDVNMQFAKPPEEITAAFDDAIKAREDKPRFEKQAETYANQVVPVAQGNASRLIAEANAYKQQVVLNAQGATAQFLALLPQYQQSPQVTRERMYLDALQSVLGNTPKILMDTPQSNNVMYLPLDKLIKKSEVSSVVDQSQNVETQNIASLQKDSNTQVAANSSASQTGGGSSAGTGSVYPARPTYDNGRQGE